MLDWTQASLRRGEAGAQGLLDAVRRLTASVNGRAAMRRFELVTIER
jgi:hypothetical protein